MKIEYKEAYELKENDIVFVGEGSQKTSSEVDIIVFALRIKKILGLNTDKSIVEVEAEQEQILVRVEGSHQFLANG
jgi:hypothetical protein